MPGQVRPASDRRREALQSGGGTPTILNAANEIAVDAFLQRRIGFLDIVATVDRVLQQLGTPSVTSLDDVMQLDAAGRQAASNFVGAVAA